MRTSGSHWQLRWTGTCPTATWLDPFRIRSPRPAHCFFFFLLPSGEGARRADEGEASPAIDSLNSCNAFPSSGAARTFSRWEKGKSEFALDPMLDLAPQAADAAARGRKRSARRAVLPAAV